MSPPILSASSIPLPPTSSSSPLFRLRSDMKGHIHLWWPPPGSAVLDGMKVPMGSGAFMDYLLSRAAQVDKKGKANGKKRMHEE